MSYKAHSTSGYEVAENSSNQVSHAFSDDGGGDGDLCHACDDDDAFSLITPALAIDPSQP